MWRLLLLAYAYIKTYIEMLLMPFAFEKQQKQQPNTKETWRTYITFKIEMFWNSRLQSDFKGIKSDQNITKQELPLKCHRNKLTWNNMNKFSWGLIDTILMTACRRLSGNILYVTVASLTVTFTGFVPWIDYIPARDQLFIPVWQDSYTVLICHFRLHWDSICGHIDCERPF